MKRAIAYSSWAPRLLLFLVVLELALKPVTIKPVFPEWASGLVCSGVAVCFTSGSATVHTSSVVDKRWLDNSGVVDLAMRSATEWTAHTFSVALGKVMTPSLTTRAEDGAGMRLGPPDL